MRSKFLFICCLMLLAVSAFAQGRKPNTFPEKTTAGDNDAVYSQEDGADKKIKFSTARKYFLPSINTVLTDAPDSTGNTLYLGQFLQTPGDSIYYVDGTGRAILIFDSAATGGSGGGGSVYVIASAGDTTTIVSPLEGDLAYVDSSLLFIRGDYWLQFSGGVALPDSLVFQSELDAALQPVEDSIPALRGDLEELAQLVDTLQHVFEIATVADTVTIPDPREGYQAITTDICATRLLYTGVYWSVLSGNVNTVPNVLSADYIGSSSGIEIPNSFSIFQEGVDSVSLRSFQRNGVELLSEEYLFEAASSSCTYTSLETLLNADGATVTAYSDNSECDGAAIIDYEFTLYNFDSLTYIIGTDLLNDTVTLYPTFAEIDTFRIVLSAASVSDVVSISDNNTGVTVTLIDSVLQYIAIDTIASASVAVIFTYCNNASSTLTAILDFANNEIIPTLPLSSRPGSVNSVPVYSSPDVLNDPGLMTLENNRATLPREVKISAMTNENKPAASAGLLGYNSTTGYFQAATGSLWFEIPKSDISTFSNTAIPYSGTNGALTESPSNLYFSNLALTVRATNNRTNINFGRTGSLTMSFQSGTTGFIITPSGSGFPILQEEFNTGNWKYTNINRMTFSQTNSNIPSGFYVRRVSDATPIFCAGGGNDPVGFNGVGIGTFNPESKLDVVSGGTTSTTRAFRVRDSALNPLFQIRDNGNVGIATTNPAYKLEIIGTGGIRITTGTTAERPTGADGVIRHNSTTGYYEGYRSGAWYSFADQTFVQTYSKAYAEAHTTATNTYDQTGSALLIDTLTSSLATGIFSYSVGTFQSSSTGVVTVDYSFTADLPDGESAKDINIQLRMDGVSIHPGCNTSQYLPGPDTPQTVSKACTFTANSGEPIGLYITTTGLYELKNISFQINQK